MSEKLITVIIPVYRDLKELQNTLTSLDRQLIHREQYEILVANDGGDEQISEYCQSHGIGVIDIRPNQGSYHARNVAAKKAATPYVAFIDAGIIADSRWLSNGLSYVQDYDYVAGDVKLTGDHINDVATFHDYLTAFPMKAYFEEIGFGGAGNLFVKKSLFDKIGYFDDRLRSCGDLEFGTRVKSDPRLTRFFAENCLCYHEPRNHKEKIIKMKRVRAGQKMLVELYGDRFSFLNKKKDIIWTLRMLLPGRWSGVNRIYQPNDRFSKWQLYLYMYRLRVIKALNDL